MLYQDTLTGMLHEVPDNQVSGWGLAEDPYGVGEAQMVYDGLGNPLGWGFLKRLVKRAVPFATSMLGPYGQIIKHALPVVTKALGPSFQAVRQQAAHQLTPAQVAPPQIPQEMQPQMEGVPVGYPQPGAYSPMAMRPQYRGVQQYPGAQQFPGGWRRPQQPNTGPQPGRLYLRCSSWRGPRGLTPINAAQGPMATPPGAAAVVPVPVPPAVGRRPARYRGRGRRR